MSASRRFVWVPILIFLTKTNFPILANFSYKVPSRGPYWFSKSFMCTIWITKWPYSKWLFCWIKKWETWSKLKNLVTIVLLTFSSWGFPLSVFDLMNIKSVRILSPFYRFEGVSHGKYQRPPITNWKKIFMPCSTMFQSIRRCF